MTHIKNPLVSICIPTYNGEHFIVEAMQSAISQTYLNLEIIVSDDASEDSTISLIEEFKEKSNIPIIIYHHLPQGIGSNWNNCIKKANGEYIKFLFQDDVLKVDCIKRMISLAVQEENVGLVFCRRDFIYDLTNIKHIKWIDMYKNLHSAWLDIEMLEGIECGKKYLKDFNFLNEPLNKIGEPTAVLLHKKCFEKVGYFNLDLKQSLDIEYWYRVMKHFKIGFIDEKLINFRLHEEQASNVNARSLISEVEPLMKSFYINLFWQLNIKSKMKLYLKFSKLGIFLRKIKMYQTTFR